LGELKIKNVSLKEKKTNQGKIFQILIDGVIVFQTAEKFTAELLKIFYQFKDQMQDAKDEAAKKAGSNFSKKILSLCFDQHKNFLKIFESRKPGQKPGKG